ncbi:MAG: hypothetical protein WDN10_04330 [bacterium]
MATENECCAQLKAQTRALYESTKKVFCPYFNQDVGFNSDGFHHFQYNTAGSERSKKAQIRRYRTFPLAPYVLKKAGTVQQHRRYFGPIGRPKGDGFRIAKVIEDWCFVALIASRPGVNIELKVVVRKIGNGALNFYSVMPFRAPDYLAKADPE